MKSNEIKRLLHIYLSIYHVAEALQTVVGRIVVVGALTRSVFFLSDLRATQMNVKRSLIS